MAVIRQKFLLIKNLSDASGVFVIPLLLLLYFYELLLYIFLWSHTRFGDPVKRFFKEKKNEIKSRFLFSVVILFIWTLNVLAEREIFLVLVSF